MTVNTVLILSDPIAMPMGIYSFYDYLYGDYPEGVENPRSELQVAFSSYIETAIEDGRCLANSGSIELKWKDEASALNYIDAMEELFKDTNIGIKFEVIDFDTTEERALNNPHPDLIKIKAFHTKWYSHVKKADIDKYLEKKAKNQPKV